MRYLLLFFISLLPYGGFLSSPLDKQRIEDLCEPNPCENGGTCTVTKGTIDCKCVTGYSGSKCELDTCSIYEYNCKENEICMIENKEPTCKKIIKNLCEPNPCENDGTCTVTNEKVDCECTSGYSGSKCEIDMCSLRLAMCKADDICVIEDGYPKCKNLCKPNPCKNGGSCMLRNGTFSCNCTNGYLGEKCENGEPGVTSEDPATKIPTNIPSTSATKTHTEKNNPTTSANTSEVTTVTNSLDTDKLTTLSNNTREITGSGTKITTSKITESTEYNDKSSGVSFTDLETRSTEMTSTRNTHDHTSSTGTNSSTTSVVNTTDSIVLTSGILNSTSSDNNPDKDESDISSDHPTTKSTMKTSTTLTTTSAKVKPNSTTSGTTKSTTSYITELVSKTTVSKFIKSTENNDKTLHVSLDKQSTKPTEMTSIGNMHNQTNSTETSSKKMVGTTSSFNNATTKTSQKYTSTISSSTLTTETSPSESQTIVTDVSTAAHYITSNLFKSSSKSWSKTSSENSTPKVDLKSTESVGSTIDFSNTTSVNNNSDNVSSKTSAASKSITTYVSLGAGLFAAVVAFAVGGWYVRRRWKRRQNQYYREYDTGSETSRNSDTSHSPA